MAKYYEEGQPFKFILDDDPEVIPVNESRIQINQVSNVIPLRIEFEIDGEVRRVSGFINYENQHLEIEDIDLPEGVEVEEFKELVMLFLRRRAMKYAALNKDIPPEVYEQLEKGQGYGNPKNMKPDDFRRK
jgi:hypothetical protein